MSVNLTQSDITAPNRNVLRNLTACTISIYLRIVYYVFFTDGDWIRKLFQKCYSTDLRLYIPPRSTYVAAYDGYADAAGHGTHVAGTLAGAESGGSAGDDDGDGMAFQGKLAVFDFGDSANDNALTTPSELDSMMLAPAFEAGARVHRCVYVCACVYVLPKNQVKTFTLRSAFLSSVSSAAPPHCRFELSPQAELPCRRYGVRVGTKVGMPPSPPPR